MKTNQPAALIVERNQGEAEHYSAHLQERGFSVSVAGSVATARECLDESAPALLLLDLDLPDGDSLALLTHPSIDHSAEIILTSCEDDPERVRKGILAGATYFFCRPSNEHFLMALFDDLAAELAPKQDPEDSLSNVTPIDQFGLLRGSAPCMRQLYRTIRRVAPTTANVLIHGESGTGKELVAQTIHHFSKRKGAPFVAMNCGAIPKDLIESELFGHEKGSFSGADRRHAGYFERAQGGTLFLDELTEMPPELQVKLLRVLENNRFHTVGGEKDITSDARIIAATNREPEQAVGDGLLREDLYFRIASFPIYVPPLRAREDDIKGLVQFFLNQFNEQAGKAKSVSHDVLKELQAYAWPGNVRELRSVIEQAYIMADSVINLGHLPDLHHTGAATHGALNLTVGETLQSAEQKLLLATLNSYGGDKRKTAKTLGVSLKTLYNRLNQYRDMQETDEETEDEDKRAHREPTDFRSNYSHHSHAESA